MRTSTIYGSADDLLLTAIADIESKLAGQEKSKGYSFWKGIIETMRYAYNHISETKSIFSENRVLRQYNNYLTERVDWLERELLKYSVTREMLENGELRTVLKRIESMGVVETKDIEEHINKLRDERPDTCR